MCAPHSSLRGIRSRTLRKCHAAISPTLPCGRNTAHRRPGNPPHGTWKRASPWRMLRLDTGSLVYGGREMTQITGTGTTQYRSRPPLLTQAGHFVRHLGEMVAAMVVGMMVGATVLAVVFTTLLASSVSGMTQREVFNQFAVLICLVVAIGMTSTMVAWMRYRGMEWRPVFEMAAAMIVPLIPIFGLLAFQLIPGAEACG